MFNFLEENADVKFEKTQGYVNANATAAGPF